MLVVKEAEVRRSALALLGRKEGTSRTRSRRVYALTILRCATANSISNTRAPIATARQMALGRSRPVARSTPSQCEAAKQALLAPHRCLPAAQPRCESLPSSWSRSSACQLLSEVMVAGTGRGRAAGISFQRAHTVSAIGERSRDWLVAPQPSPAASLFIIQGEHFGAFPRQPLRLHLTRKAIPVDACSS